MSRHSHKRITLFIKLGLSSFSLLVVSSSLAAAKGDNPCSCCIPSPSNLRAVGIWDTSLNMPTDILTWSASPEAVSYNIYFGLRMVASGITGTHWTVPTQRWAPYRTYFVTAVNAQGIEGRQSRFTPASGAPDPAGGGNMPHPPHIPTTLTVMGEWNDGAPRMFIAWHRMGTTTSFKVYRDGTLIASELDAAFYYDYHVAPGSKHSYAVSGVNGRGVLESESAACSPVKGTAPQSAPSMSGNPIQITNITPNDDSALISFAPAAGAIDYRISRSDIPGEYKYSGGGQSVEINGIDPSTGVDVVIEAIDKLGPYTGTGMSMHINGLGDPSNVPNVVARSDVFHVSCQPQSLTGDQVFFDNFANPVPFSQVAPDPNCLKATGPGLYQQYENDRWRAGFFLDDTDVSSVFFDHRHLMTMLADYLHQATSSMVLMPKATADISSGRVLHVTFEVDPHYTTRRWVDLTFCQAGEVLVRPATDIPHPNPTNSGMWLALTWNRDHFSYMMATTGTAIYTRHISRSLVDGLMSDIDKRHRFDVYISQTHIRVLEAGQLLEDTDYAQSWTLPFDRVQMNLVHQLYHTDNEHPELKDLYQMETFWINYRPYVDERHWDNIGFEVLSKMPQ